jgi:undecaprenyl-diphosphatase
MADSSTWLGELRALDRAVYAAVAGTPTPSLDAALQPLTSAADYSRLWLGVAAATALLGGRRGRRGALEGVAAIGLASASVNLVLKHVSRRRRPDRVGVGVPVARHVVMPTSTSFPSGHSAAAFAFAGGMADGVPALGIPLHLASATVAYTRVHSGVHYPGDVLAGSLVGIACGRLGPIVVQALSSRLGARAGAGGPDLP